jgi:transposase-like protein
MHDAAPVIIEETPPCPRCSSVAKKLGFLHYASGSKVQRFYCKACRHVFCDEAERAAADKDPTRGGRPKKICSDADPCPRCASTDIYEYIERLQGGGTVPRLICRQCRKMFTREKDRAKPTPEQPAPTQPENINEPITSGTWRVKPRLAQSLSAMFQHAHGFRPEEVTLNTFVSEILANEVASFRLTHSDFIFRSQSRPPRRVLDPCKTVKEEVSES